MLARTCTDAQRQPVGDEGRLSPRVSNYVCDLVVFFVVFFVEVVVVPIVLPPAVICFSKLLSFS